MSGGIVLTLIALAQQLKQMARLIEKQVGGVPGIVIPLPVTITPELSEPVFDIKYFSVTATDYEELLKYTVEKGYKLYLSEIGIHPGSNCQDQGRFMIKIGGVNIGDLKLLTSVSVDFFWLQLFEGAEVSIYVKSLDASAVTGNALYSGRKVRVPPQYPKV